MTVALARLDPAAFRAVIFARQRDGFSASDVDPATAARLERLFHREIDVREAVREIIADVRLRGDAALREWTYRIDGVDVDTVHVDPAAMAAAWDGLAGGVRDALRAAAERLREFHMAQVDILDRGIEGAWLHPVPLGRVGCYVPGGRAAYPSTVLMSVIPAQVAGVEHIVVASPPAPSGGVHPLVASAAHLLGVRELVVAGGAQAIAALAFGTESITRVDKIVGPGNAFVTLAKHEVFGVVGIDQLAGPSEIVVIATAGADPEMVAADLVSQLEHDPLAWAICLTDDEVLAESIAACFAEAAGDAARREIIGIAAGKHAAVVHCDSHEEMLTLAAAFAPEHLSLQGAAAEFIARLGAQRRRRLRRGDVAGEHRGLRRRAEPHLADPGRGSIPRPARGDGLRSMAQRRAAFCRGVRRARTGGDQPRRGRGARRSRAGDSHSPEGPAPVNDGRPDD